MFVLRRGRYSHCGSLVLEHRAVEHEHANVRHDGSRATCSRCEWRAAKCALRGEREVQQRAPNAHPEDDARRREAIAPSKHSRRYSRTLGRARVSWLRQGPYSAASPMPQLPLARGLCSIMAFMAFMAIGACNSNESGPRLPGPRRSAIFPTGCPACGNDGFARGARGRSRAS